MLLRSTNCHKSLFRLGIYSLIILHIFNQDAKAQVFNDTLRLSLTEAITLSKAQNKWIKVAKIEEKATDADLKDAYNAALPSFNSSASYQRFSDLTLFYNGLLKSSTGPRKPTPNAASLGIDASFNIYAGGRQHALEEEQTVKKNIASINSQDQTGYIGLQTAAQYLDLLRLAELRKFILDQLKRAQARLQNINALYRNQKVTRSDVLRAEVMQSNVELSLQQTDNDITISNQKLNILLNVPDTVKINPIDSAGMPKPTPAELQALLGQSEQSAYAIQKADQSVNLQQARLKGVKSNSSPNLSFFTAYGLNYPNNLFFPPVDQAYAIGFVGLRAQYSISSLYQNKHKIAAGNLRIAEAKEQEGAVADNVRQEINGLLIKYKESLNRIAVNEKSIEQAQVNYRIVNTKYFNQLALLTDLLDADNLYTASRFELIRAQTDALAIYYRLLYTAGKL